MSKCSFLATLIVALPLSNLAGRSTALAEVNPRCTSATPAPLAEWTLLVYMNGDNNLEQDALLNFEQMARVGSTAAVNAIVQFDRIGKYAHTNPDWTQTLRFRIEKGMKPLPARALQDIGEANMGDPAVLACFVQWGRAAFPARRYALVIWDHGQGWRIFLANMLRRHRSLFETRAISSSKDADSLRASAATLRDETGDATEGGKTASFRSAPGAPYRSASNDETDHDVLYNREIEDGLKSALGSAKLDVIGFDACLMSMVETAYALRDVGSYMVGSEELEPGLGWDYQDWLRRIVAKPSMAPAELARTTVESYRVTYGKPSGDPTTTLAATDLGKIEAVAASLSDFAEAANKTLDQEVQAIVEARAATAQYAPGYFFMHVDLKHFLDEYAARTGDPDLRKRAQKARVAVEAAVVLSYAGASRQGPYGSNGLAIYFPSSGAQYASDPYNEGGYEKGNHHYPVEFVQNFQWSDFLHLFWAKVPAP